MKQSPNQELDVLLQMQRTAFAQDPLPDLPTRRSRLDRLLALTRDHAGAIARAISDDFGHRSRDETFLLELAALEQRVKHSRRHLPHWMRMRRVATTLQFMPGRNRLLPQPLGVVGILSPWNYPLDLSLGPAVDALAAGNRVMIKPSELCPRFALLLARLVGEYFDPAEMLVVPGDAALAASFCALPFDHLVFTGSTQVGRLVAAAAAKNLTPLTLELGGKSPVIIDPDCDLQRSAARLAWGKLVNAGQTCIAPDYLLVPRAREAEVVQALVAAMQKLYPALAANPDYTSIISPGHWQRLHALLDDASARGALLHVVNPAQESFDPAQRKMAPVLLTGVTPDMRVMQEEIFGPILPILAYDSFDEAIAYVNRHERPLALYWFGNDKGRRERVLRETISGGVCINDCLLHQAQGNQPFGGVGPSGQGAYHGEWGFNAFSKLKPIFIQSRWNGMALINPPYGKLVRAAYAHFRRGAAPET